MAPSDDVQLTDLEVIAQFSLAVRGATASRGDVIAALEADLAFLAGGGTSRGRAKPASNAGPSATQAPDEATSAPGKATSAPGKATSAPGKATSAPGKAARRTVAPAKASAKKAATKAARTRT